MINNRKFRLRMTPLREWTLHADRRVPPLRVDDLIEDLKDGIRLIALLEVLANTKLVRSHKINFFLLKIKRVQKAAATTCPILCHYFMSGISR